MKNPMSSMQPGPVRARSTDGSVLMVVVVLTAVTAMMVGSILYATSSYLRMAEASHDYDRATYMAESGLNAAVVKMNTYMDANISYQQSRAYFQTTNELNKVANWGFNTVLSVDTNGESVVTSTGRFRGQTVTISSAVAMANGSRRVHALYAHALYAGNSTGATNYTLEIGGTGTAADFVLGDVYSGGKIALSGQAKLRLPELLADTDNDGIQAVNETWQDAFTSQTFTQGLSFAAFATYTNSMKTVMSNVYANTKWDRGEAWLDGVGNNQYDLGEAFTDSNANGVRDPGDQFTDTNGNGVRDAGEPFVDLGNGVYNAGEEWIEDSVHKISGKAVRVNGKWDKYGGYWKTSTSWISNTTTRYWAAESFEDRGDGIYVPGEAFVDANGVYDQGEKYCNDRNGLYDYGTQATGTIGGMPAPSTGQRASTGGDPAVNPPNLTNMYYYLSKTGGMPGDALPRWGHDYMVNLAAYSGYKCITDTNNAAHIFICNPGNASSGSDSSRGKTIQRRVYTYTYDNASNRVNDFFFEDAADSAYNSSTAPAICANDNVTRPDGSIQNNVTDSQYVDIRPWHNSKVYFVDGNLWIHSPNATSFRFKRPGTRVTFVARGNITISDEFYYNADYPTGTNQLDYSVFNSTKVPNPTDSLCLIALYNPNCTNSGNIFLGDSQFGTGGAVHSMMYAERDFMDSNLDTAAQPFLSVFGNMSAGNHVSIIRSGSFRTRLDITLDERIRSGTLIAPGLPNPVGLERGVVLDTAWGVVRGSWRGPSRL